MEFRDRKGTNLNRKKIKIISQTPTEIIADIERFDNVTEEGTEINANVFNTFQSEITSAVTNANEAKTESNTAKNNAQNALDTANSANTKSDNALQTASLANTNSTSALTTANNANVKSDTAVLNANKAFDNSNEAITVASSAKTESSTALTTANDAFTKSKSAIQSASEAKSTAETALENSKIAISDSDFAKNKAIAVENALADRGATVYVNEEAMTTIEFDSDPQTQINNKLSKNFDSLVNKQTLNNDDLLVIQDSQTDENLKVSLATLKSSIMSVAFPVGAIYISTSSTNPSSLFGGTWTQIEDMFLLGAGSIYTAGSTGGESTHVLTDVELPSHNHNNTISVSATQSSHMHSISSGTGKCTNAGGLGYGYVYAVGGPDNDKSSRSDRTTTAKGVAVMNNSQPAITVTSSITNANTGSNQAHNNMPPYLAVYIWQRIS